MLPRVIDLNKFGKNYDDRLGGSAALRALAEPMLKALKYERAFQPALSNL
jgi:hypothetical protein